MGLFCVAQMIASLESIALIAALQLSFFVPVFRHASTSAHIANAYASGIGTAYLLLSFTLVYG
eukprot:COSAG01_NODE_39851_length_471_cov_0.970430_1_plen_62_part_01